MQRQCEHMVPCNRNRNNEADSGQSVPMLLLDEHGIRDEISLGLGKRMHAHLAEAMYARTGAIVSVAPNVAAGCDIVEDHGKERLKFPGSEIPYRERPSRSERVRLMAAIIVGKAVPCRIAVFDLELTVENVADVLAVLENRDEVTLSRDW